MKKVLAMLAASMLFASTAEARFSYEQGTPPLPGAVESGSTISFSPESGSVAPAPTPTHSVPATVTGGVSRAGAPDPAIREAIESARRSRMAAQRPEPAQRVRKTSARAAKSVPVVAQQPVYVGSCLRLTQGSLRTQLEKFCVGNGSSLAWRASTDIMISNDATFDRGSFEGTLSALFEALNTSGHYFKAEYFRGNSLLLVDDLRK